MNYSNYSPASWNTGLYLNQLQKEIDALKYGTGYYWNLITDNGLQIQNFQTYSNISAPVANNTARAHSNIQRITEWTITAQLPGFNQQCIMWFGISTDINQSFPGFYQPSCQNCNYGLFIEYISGNAVSALVNGALTGPPIASIVTGNEILKIVYDGSTLSYYINTSLMQQYTNVSLDAVNLVCGSIYGGSLKNITWSGITSTGIAPPPAVIPTLSQVLAQDSDANEQSINNLLACTISNGGFMLDTVSVSPSKTILATAPARSTNQISARAGAYSLYELDMTPFGGAALNTVYDTFTVHVKALTFTGIIQQEVNPFFLFFYFCDTPNGTLDITNPLNIGWTSSQLLATSGQQIVGPLVMCFQSTTKVQKLYFNFRVVFINPTDPDFNINLISVMTGIQIDATISPQIPNITMTSYSNP